MKIGPALELILAGHQVARDSWGCGFSPGSNDGENAYVQMFQSIPCLVTPGLTRPYMATPIDLICTDWEIVGVNWDAEPGLKEPIDFSSLINDQEGN